MSSIVYPMLEVLSTLVGCFPVGTNLGLLHVLWAICSGQLLTQRGALIPALAATGLDDRTVRRAWSAVARGRWQCARMVAALATLVKKEARWQAHVHGGYKPVACDLTAFYRPTLQDCHTSHYDSHAQRQLPAVVFGLLVRVGAIGKQRIPVAAAIVRADDDQASEAELMQRTLRTAAAQLADDEALIVDRGFSIGMLESASVTRYVVRCQSNFAPCRAKAEWCGKGRRPKYGAVVRPLARRYKDNTLAATAADETETWQEETKTGAVKVTAQVWTELTTKKSPAEAPHFRCVLISDPRFKKPLMLASTLAVSARDLRNLYVDRWPVEMVPQTAKQMLGAERQFVHAAETRQRLPELILVAACTMLYVAATMDPYPTGYWDRKAQPTAGRLRRCLTHIPFPQMEPLTGTIRKKQSVTDHLPKGINAHRRQPKASKVPNQPQNRKQPAKVTRN